MDEGEYGLGKTTQPLQPQDCPSNAVFIPATLADDRGHAFTLPNALCIFERTPHMLWKHFDVFSATQETRAAREVVLRYATVVGNYDYFVEWVFSQDGSLRINVGAGGIPDHEGGREPASERSQRGAGHALRGARRREPGGLVPSARLQPPARPRRGRPHQHADGAGARGPPGATRQLAQEHLGLREDGLRARTGGGPVPRRGARPRGVAGCESRAAQPLGLSGGVHAARARGQPAADVPGRLPGAPGGVRDAGAVGDAVPPRGAVFRRRLSQPEPRERRAGRRTWRTARSAIATWWCGSAWG